MELFFNLHPDLGHSLISTHFFELVRGRVRHVWTCSCKSVSWEVFWLLKIWVKWGYRGVASTLARAILFINWLCGWELGCTRVDGDLGVGFWGGHGFVTTGSWDIKRAFLKALLFLFKPDYKLIVESEHLGGSLEEFETVLQHVILAAHLWWVIERIDELKDLDPLGSMWYLPCICQNEVKYVHKLAFKFTWDSH